MGRDFSKSGDSRREWCDRKHKFEHWYRDRSVYFITARVREKLPVFVTPETTAIFWGKFDQYTTQHGFDPWVASLLSTHYHFVGLLQKGAELREMMRKLHGSVAWLVCKELTFSTSRSGEMTSTTITSMVVCAMKISCRERIVTHTHKRFGRAW